MAFLQEEDDASVFEAALSFVDECSLDCLGPSTEILAASAVSELPPFKSEQCHAVFGGPSFAIDCREAATMVPLNMKSLLNDAIAPDLRLSLPPSNETMTRPKTTKAKKVSANPNRVRDEAQYELAFLREKVAELELQLKNLQLNAASSAKVNAMASRPRQLVQVPLVWKDMAVRQRRRLEEAQRENVRLRLIAERKRKMATGLSVLLRKRLTQQVRIVEVLDENSFHQLELRHCREWNACVEKDHILSNAVLRAYWTSKVILKTSRTFFSIFRLHTTKSTLCLLLADFQRWSFLLATFMSEKALTASTSKFLRTKCYLSVCTKVERLRGTILRELKNTLAMAACMRRQQR
ncbi:hypothetical protein Pcac1_g28347 [Phytophthora cactorum]|nr:hypothetical protein Pcac1_g28347 [Phytophthora cactorum]